MLMEYSGILTGKPYKFLMSTFSGKEFLNVEKSCRDLNLIFSYCADELDRREHDGVLALYRSTKDLVIDYLDKEENERYSKMISSMNALLG